jgi:hypothetical protein
LGASPSPSDHLFPHDFEFSDGDGTLYELGVDGAIVTWDARSITSALYRTADADGSHIHWDFGTLQYSPAVHGPWIDLPAASPFNLQTIAEKGFFRVKVQ